MVDNKTIDLFFSQARKLIPLKRVRYDLPDDDPWNKRPLYNNWNEREHTKKQIEQFARKKHNIGWCLGPKDLIIDVDARNNGIEGFELLQADFPQIDFSFFPSVSTGGGGYHLYSTIQKEIDRARIRKTLQRYPGVEFLSDNRQILIPGCIHPNGKEYKWILNSPFNELPPEIPNRLHQLITNVSFSQKDNKTDQLVQSPTLHTTSELANLLSKLPVEEYDDNDSWFALMAAAHHCTAGEGVTEFLDWSLADPEYQDDEAIIRSRWESLGRNEIDPRTVRTLYREVQKHGGELPTFTTALEDFDDDFTDDSSDILASLFDSDSDSDVRNNTRQDRDSKTDERNKINLEQYIGKLTDKTPIERINKAITQIGKLTPSNQDRFIKELSNKTSIRRETIRRQIRSESKQKQTDIEQRIADQLLSEHYADGKHLIYTVNQRYRVFDKTHWAIRPRHLLEKHIEAISEGIREDDPESEFNIARIFAGVDRLARGRVMVEDDLFSMKDGPPPILNLANGELHFNSDGTSELKKHNYKYHLPWCLDHIKFKKTARCELFDSTLAEIFSKTDDPKDVIRHLWEVLGYTIQSEKNLPIWCMFYGGGADGKSTVIRVWAALLGPASISQSLSSLDIRRNKHAYSELPGKLMQYDADLADGVYLPEAYLKNVSEAGWLLADPKGMQPFNFRACLTSIAATNYLPPIRNLSKGVARRAMLIPFNRSFKREEQDIYRADTVTQNELPGVLNKALQGLKRLRKRGYFKEPAECIRLKNTWMEHSSNILAFLNEVQPIKIDSWRHRKINAKDLYEQLTEWYNAEEIEGRNRVSYRGMLKKLRDMGFIIKRGAGGLTSVEVRR